MGGQEIGSDQRLMPKFLPELGLEIQEGTVIAVQLVDDAKGAWVYYALFKNGERAGLVRKARLLVVANRPTQYGFNCYFMSGRTLNLSAFSKVTVHIKDAEGNQVGEYST